MKTLYYTTFIFAVLLLTVSTATAQNENVNDAPRQNLTEQKRPNLLSELDLSPSQIQQIRQINRSQQSSRRAAQQRVKEARISLDEAIYADDFNETEIQNRLKEFNAAQTEAAQNKAMNELEIRKVLTPEQLVKFREVRRRFAERMENLPAAQRNRPLNAPNRRLLNRQRRLRQN